MVFQVLEEIVEGDLVLLRDERDPSGLVVAQRVEEVFVRQGLVMEVTACGRAIRTTSEHPFYVGGKGWTKAQELQEGDLLLCEDGTSISVQSVVDTGSWETVYNFRVSEFHTYFVGCDEWGFSVWAHNTYDDPKLVRKFTRALQDAGLRFGRTTGTTSMRLAT